MVEVYCKLIKEGLRTLESIKDPRIREAVKAKLESEEWLLEELGDISLSSSFSKKGDKYYGIYWKNRTGCCGLS